MKRIILGSVCLSIAALASCGDSAPKDDAAPAAGIVSAEGDFATNLQDTWDFLFLKIPKKKLFFR